MIDPLISLAFSIYSNRGAYALLLGSGVSRAAAIPSGWEVVLDLVRKVAALEGEDSEPDPAAWFLKKHGNEPEYSTLLDIVAKTSTERQQLLRSYFEPTEEERSEGLKSPTAAHRAIAELAGTGYLRVIITTNFDRLLEKAMEELGVTPTVISTPDQIAGALPLVHSGITIIKLHGDYFDTRIKNTAKELARYNPKLSALVDRILDEYGLILCGWSAEWDIALREAIERCASRRFTTYWATRSPLSGHAKRLAEHRRAELIQITSADELFVRLSENIQALEDTSAPHPLSAKIAVATVKRYLVDPAARIKLHDLVYEETQKACAQLGEDNFPLGQPQPSLEEYSRRARKYEAIVETLLAIITTGCFWGDASQSELWVKAIERIVDQPRPQGTFFPDLEKMRTYPALLLMYGGGIAALASKKHDLLAAILTQPQFLEGAERSPLIAKFSGESVSAVVDRNTGRASGLRLHSHLQKFIRERFLQVISRDQDFQEIFDRFEYLFGLVRVHLSAGWTFWAGEYLHRFGGTSPRKMLEEEVKTQGTDCAYLRAGMFEGGVAKLTEVQAALVEKQKHITRW
jgi:hypothetical protein